jgi:hypothetical protein
MRWNFVVATIFMSLLLVSRAYAHCPLCTAAVGTGVAVTRFYGVDDTIVGTWIGAFIISTALWFNKALKKKYIKFQNFLVVVLALMATIVPFYFAGLINMQYKLFGIDKLLLGILVGSFVTYFGTFLSDKIRKKGFWFPFQTIAMVLILLILTSIIFWCVISIFG